MKILVTGAAGHLGANLVRALLDRGEHVRVLLRQGSNNTALDGLEVERVYGDLRDFESLRAATRGIERVYHCAAKISTVSETRAETQMIFDCNVVGTRNLLRAAREARCGRVVVTGSFSAVGHFDERPSTEDDPFFPFEKCMPYERSKAWVEHECLKAVVEGQDVVIATSCSILGPHDFKPSRMGMVVRDYANGKLRAYIPGGFEFVSADDIVQGHLLAMEKGRSGQKYVFSTQYVTLDELMEVLQRVTGRSKPRLRIPAPVMAVVAEVSGFVLTRFFPQVPQRLTPGAVRILRQGRKANLSKARDELGYRPTSVEDAVRKAYEWFLARGEIVGRAPASMAPKISGGAERATRTVEAA